LGRLPFQARRSVRTAPLQSCHGESRGTTSSDDILLATIRCLRRRSTSAAGVHRVVTARGTASRNVARATPAIAGRAFPNVLRATRQARDLRRQTMRHASRKGRLRHRTGPHGEPTKRVIKIGPYRGNSFSQRLRLDGRKNLSSPESGRPRAIVHPELRDNTVRVQLEQQPGRGRAAGHRHPTGEIKAMIGGTVFEIPNSTARAGRPAKSAALSDLCLRRRARERLDASTPSSICVYHISGGQPYSPRNYEENLKGPSLFAGLWRVHATSRRETREKKSASIPVVDMTNGFGITTPLPPYLPLALGART